MRGATRRLIAGKSNAKLMSNQGWSKMKATVWLIASLVFFSSTGAYAGSPTSAQEITVALLGDTGAYRDFQAVLKLVKDEQAQVVMINGDLGYSATPEKWRETLLKEIDPNAQFVIGSLGNHDFEHGRQDDYVGIFHGLRNAKNSLPSRCSGGLRIERGRDIAALDEVCTFGNLTIIASGIGQLFSKSYFEDRLREKLSNKPADNWALVGYHYTLASMNPGLKTNENTHKFFDLIRQFGAIGAQAHTHTVMASCPINSEFKTSGNPSCHPDFGADLEDRFIEAGTGIFIDSSLGGMPPRSRRRCHRPTDNGCAHMVDLVTKEGYTRVDGRSRNDFIGRGAVFVKFNLGGDPSRARAYFKSVDGREVFSFHIRR